MDNYGSVFGGLGKKKKKKGSKNKSPHHHQNGKNAIKSPPAPTPEANVEQPEVPQGEIRFVLPRSSSKSSTDKLIPFLFPKQLQQLAKKGLLSNDISEAEQQKTVTTSTEKKFPTSESIDDILFPEKKSKTKDKKRKLSEVDGADAPKETSKKQKSKDPVDTSIGSSKKPDSEPPTTSEKAEKDDTKNKNKSKQKSPKEEQAQELNFSQNNVKILARSVEDAIKDKVGRRPRANSTDGELNLPQRGLCDERIVLQSHKWNTGRFYNMNEKSAAAITPPPRGFVNLGNTCFMNATLQCLLYMPSFCQSITALPKSCYDTNGSSKKLHGQRITMGLRALARMAHGITFMEKNEPPRTKPLAPKTIHGLVTSCKTSGHRFRPGRQEDAHELLVHLLDAMHEGELLAAGINPHASGWRDRLPIPRLDETTFVHRIFGGYFRSQLLCNKCGYKSNTYDPFLDLALEVSKKHLDSLSSAFKEFSRKETLDSDNRWKCSGCKKMVCPTKHLSVFRPPLSLCIQLKRFVFGGGGGGFNRGGGWGYGHRHGKGLSMMGGGGSKITKKIDFPSQLSLPLSDGRKCEYVLTGVIIHVGNSATSGHYTAYVKQPGDSKQWYHMDDSFVEVVSEKTVLKQRDAYVLFYSRKEVKLEFPQPPPREASLKNGIKATAPVSKAENESKSPSSKSKREDADTKKKSNKTKEKAKQVEKTTPSSTPVSLKSTSSSASPAVSDSSAIKHAHEANSSSESDSSSSDSDSSDGKESKNGDFFGGIKRSLSFSKAHKMSTPDDKNLAKVSLNPVSVSPAKSESSAKKGEKKMQGSNVEVVLSRKKKKAWKPMEATKINSGNESKNVLLGNIAVGNWDDSADAATTSSNKKKEALREMATKEMESADRSRKRKMHLDKWDAMIDEGKRKKVKVKNPDNAELMKKSSDSFQRIQRDMQRMNKGRAKGFRPTKDANNGRVGSMKKKKQKSVKRS